MTPGSFLSIHIDADGCNEADINRAGRFLAATGAAYYNLTTAARYNEAEKLIRILKAQAPKARALWRGWPNVALEDGGIWQRTMPQEWVNYRIAPNAKWLNELDVLVVTCNEVGVIGEDAKHFAQWEADSARLSFLQYAVSLAMLRYSTGTPRETEHDNYNAALQAASEFDGVLTPNEYTSTNAQITTNWHVGRYRWMWQQQDKLVVKRSPVVIGEYGIAHVNADKSLDPHKGYDGEGVNIDQHLAVIKRDGQIYQADEVTVCWFSFGHWQEGKGTFDLQSNEPLLAAVETEAKAGTLNTSKRITQALNPVVVVTPAVYGNRYTLTLPGALISGYADTSISSGSMGTVPNNAVVLFVDESVVGTVTWRKVKYAALTTWIDMTNVKMDAYIPPPVPAQPAPIPAPLLRSISISVVQEQMFRDMINELRADASAKLARAQMIEDCLGLPSGA